MSEWKPDDSILKDKNQAGVDRVKRVLERNGLNLERLDHIVTSRDPEWVQARHELRRENMPPGWETWQLPTYLLNSATLFFLTVSAPGAVLPKHHHDVPQIRIVCSGGLIYDGKELKSGDWMYIPAKVDYVLTASLNPGGCVSYYAY